jgi:hypothetical protein
LAIRGAVPAYVSIAGPARWVTPSKAFSPSASPSWFVVDDGFDDDPAAVAGLFTHPDAGEHACDDLPTWINAMRQSYCDTAGTNGLCYFLSATTPNTARDRRAG